MPAILSPAGAGRLSARLSDRRDSVVLVTNTVTELDFSTLTEPLRPELVAHCYRMLGSVHDAEDQVQETYLRAWRGYRGFEGRSSIRTWMYQIATRTCLTALQQRGRRPLPTGLGTPASDPSAELESRPEVPWLEPLPDSMVAAPGADPASVAATRDGVRLAFAAALQQLTPNQRAVLILRDVLMFSAAETAQTLGTTVAAANSALQRARAGMPDGAGAAPAPLGARERDLVERYIRAFNEYDTAALVTLLTQDASWEMPPFVSWYSGREAIRTLVHAQCPASGRDDMRLRPVTANGQPGCAMWMRGPDGVHRAFQLHVLELQYAADGAPAVRHVTAFFDTDLFERFGLPLVWPGDR
jgi:RNA polymerase sigma-70 factor, ECF subfamily